MPKGIPKDIKISPKCPPLLRQLILQHGSRVGAAHASKTGTTTIARIADGTIEMSDAQRFRIEAALNSGPSPITTEKRTMAEVEKPPVVIPPWNKKMGTYKFKNPKGKTVTLKLPADLVQLVKISGNNLNGAARSIGFSGWNTVGNNLEGKYAEKVHPRVYAALNGLPLPMNGHGGAVGEEDHYTLGIAVCIISLADYERLEDMATILSGTLVTKMSAGNVWIVIYKFSSRDKQEKFAKLARRDAKKIVCP